MFLIRFFFGNVHKEQLGAASCAFSMPSFKDPLCTDDFSEMLLTYGAYLEWMPLVKAQGIFHSSCSSEALVNVLLYLLLKHASSVLKVWESICLLGK